MLPYIAVLVFSLVAWDLGRRATVAQASKAQLTALQTSLDTHLESAMNMSVDISNLKAVTAAQGQTLAKHAGQLTREALEKTQPLSRAGIRR